jgi:ankyrin repeat protein
VHLLKKGMFMIMKWKVCLLVLIFCNSWAADTGLDLLNAVKSGDVERVRLLLAQGVDPNLKDSVGNTPLSWATVNGNIEMVKLLLEHKADPDIADKVMNITSLYQAAADIKEEEGEIEKVKLLLKYGADPNIVDTDNVTPLYWAADNGNTEMVKLLLEHKADPNIADKPDNITPLHLAADNGNTEIVKLLLKYGADKTLATKKGETAADIARERGHEALATLIESYIPSLQHVILHKIRRDKIDVSDPNIPPGILEY